MNVVSADVTTDAVSTPGDRDEDGRVQIAPTTDVKADLKLLPSKLRLLKLRQVCPLSPRQAATCRGYLFALFSISLLLGAQWIAPSRTFFKKTRAALSAVGYMVHDIGNETFFCAHEGEDWSDLVFYPVQQVQPFT
jgi:hypothetical protein